MVAVIQQLCGMTCDLLVNPYFFETPTPSGPKGCSVTGTSRVAMLREQMIPVLQERHCLETTIFMQDGVPPHIANTVEKLLHDTFGADRVIRRGFKNAWPHVHRTSIIALFICGDT
ncbi:uncharacterized protein TNCV_1188641 [Trichonephila clavipes]|nr:uncharacterized protein TNCV_1188641 [Trichonephila clavipes]